MKSNAQQLTKQIRTLPSQRSALPASNGMKRIFLAIKISGHLQQEIIQWESQFRQLPVRWLAPESLHITLVPPWHAHDEEIEEAKGILRTLCGGAYSFDVKFTRVTYGPRPRKPRLIWAAGETPCELTDLIALLNHALKKKEERRPFKLHLTLARFRPEQFSSFTVRNLNENVDWQDMVDTFVLMHSLLTRSGAEYGVLETFSLCPSKKTS